MVPRWTLSPAPFLTRFWSDNHVVLCWLVGCTKSWVWFQHSNECGLIASFDWGWYISWQMTLRHYLIGHFFFFLGGGGKQPVFCSVLLWCGSWGRHGGHSLVFFIQGVNCYALTGWSCWLIGDSEPCIEWVSDMSIHSFTHWLIGRPNDLQINPSHLVCRPRGLTLRWWACCSLCFLA